MEDGVETGNQIVHNPGIQTKYHPALPYVPATSGYRRIRVGAGQRSEDALLPSDNTAAIYWITSPSNDYIDNMVAGSDSTRFWFSLPEPPNGAFEGTKVSANTWPRRMPQGVFRGNTSHSSFDGLMFGCNINADNTFGVTGSSHIARVAPSDPGSTATLWVKLVVDASVEDRPRCRTRWRSRSASQPCRQQVN